MKTMIGGKEYNLKSDNEELLRMAAEFVNSEIENLEKKLSGESQATIAVLVALNIAETYYQETEQNNIDKEFLRAELQRMTEQLDQQMRSA